MFFWVGILPWPASFVIPFILEDLILAHLDEGGLILFFVVTVQMFLEAAEIEVVLVAPR